MALDRDQHTALYVHLSIKGFSEVSGLSMGQIGGKIAKQIATMPPEQREELAIETCADMNNLYRMHLEIMGDNA